MEKAISNPVTVQSGGTNWVPGREETGIRKVALIVEAGQDVLHWADLSRLLDPAQAEVTLVSQVFYTDKPGKPASSSEANEVPGIVSTALEAKLLEQRAKLHGTLHQAGFQIVNEARCGSEDGQIQSFIEMLEESEQQMVIIACAPGKRASHFSYYLATHCRLPVLLLRRPLVIATEPLKVMLAVDGSEASMNSARQLGRFIRPDNTQVELVTVQSPIYQENAVLAPYVNQTVLDDALQANANMVFEMVQDILEPQGIAVSNKKRILGSPASELGALAELEHPDLLVVGSHNRKGVLAWLLGSVSSQLLHWDTHNLLVVR